MFVFVEFTELECPYLSPLVLRKEVETAVSSFSADLSSPDRFRRKHATIFWNLMWYLRHLDLPLDILVGAEDARAGVDIHRLVYYAIAHESKGHQTRAPRLGDIAEDLAIMTESFKVWMSCMYVREPLSPLMYGMASKVTESSNVRLNCTSVQNMHHFNLEGSNVWVPCIS